MTLKKAVGRNLNFLVYPFNVNICILGAKFLIIMWRTHKRMEFNLKLIEFYWLTVHKTWTKFNF